MASYATPQFSQTLINPARSSAAVLKAYLIKGVTTSPLSSSGKSYLSDIIADNAPSGYLPITLSSNAASVVSGQVRLTSADFVFADAVASDGPIVGVAVVYWVTGDSDSPFAMIDVSGLTTSERTPTASGIEFTVGTGGYMTLDQA